MLSFTARSYSPPPLPITSGPSDHHYKSCNIGTALPMPPPGMQPGASESFLTEENLNNFFSDAQAMEKGESKMKVHWTSSLHPTREQDFALESKRESVITYPGPRAFTPEHENNIPSAQNRVMSKSSSISTSPRASFPKVARPLTPVLTGQNLFNRPSSMTLPSPFQAPGLGITYYPTSDADIPTARPKSPAGIPVNERESGATGITFFEQYETLSHFLSVASPSAPVDRSAADSPCSTLSSKTHYSSVDCKHNCICCGNTGTAYQLGICLCVNCYPNNSASNSSSRSQYLRSQRQTHKPEETNPEVHAPDHSSRSRWNSWWSTLTTSFSRPNSLAKNETRTRASSPSASAFASASSASSASPILPAAQEAMLNPDLGNERWHIAAAGSWVAEEEKQGEGERVATEARRVRNSRMAIERAWRETWEVEFPLPELP